MVIIYWLVVLVLIYLPYYFLSKEQRALKAVSVFAILLVSFISYSMYFEQLFAKKYGGTQTITVPEGERFIGISWKSDNFWLITHDIYDNICFYREHSKFSTIQGKIKIKNCNPV